jgi:putative ATP-dependent endonuclease of the OLD family
MSDAAIIHQLRIDRFRGIESLKWNPAPGMNVILGGGDVGKTTILDAIALLLSPSNAIVLSEADYWQRKYDTEFVIQAVISLPASSEISNQQKFAWPWEWNGEEVVPPIAPDSDEDDLPAPTQPVYRLQVRGSPDLEINWEIVQPNDDVDLLSVAVRRKIGCVRLGGDDRNDRDLRLVYGSALDRLLADKGLRARIGQQVSEIDLQDKLGQEAKKALEKLDKSFKEESLPNKLELGLTSSQGLSIGALIGLLAERADGVPLPLASWGSGTRRMATLQIAAATETETRITVIDEIERGLEPYRVRKLIKALQHESTQCFVTTHSSVAISSADTGCLWYLDEASNIGELPHDKITKQQEHDPETFLSRFAIIAEGPTEVGFISYVLEQEVDGDLADNGLRVCDGQGNPAVLNLLEAMVSGNLTFGGFVDNEGDSSGRWKSLQDKLGALLFQWESGCTEENVISLVEESNLIELIKDEDGVIDPERCLTLATRLGIEQRDMDTIVASTDDLRSLIIAAASGCKEGAPDNVIKTWKKHGRRWFKSEAGGRELASKMMTLGVWPEIKPKLLPFLNAVRTSLGQSKITDA